jgi:DNA-directed RNA polymerase III subunit RPC8
MFNLVTIKDKVRIEPDHFSKEYITALEDEIHSKYSNKILPEVGLCVSIYDILKVSDPFVYPGDGATHTEVIFRLIVFRPFVGEVLCGKIISSDSKNGIQVSMGMFDDIWIPPFLMQENSYFQEQENLWVWKYQEHEMYFDLGEEIRFKVNSLLFHTMEQDSRAPKVDLTVKRPIATSAVAVGASSDRQQQLQTQQQNKDLSELPMIIYGRLNQSGLGLTSWWE